MSTLQAIRQTCETGEQLRRSDDAGRARIVDSAELLAGRRELWIEHGEDMYRLRLTAAGKLYLTK